jgi:type II secretory pathway pseudopilin PulG
MNTSTLIVIGGIGVLALNAPSLIQSQQQAAALQQTRNSTKQVERQIREESREALTRYQGNCARVVDGRSRAEIQLIEGMPVVDPATGRPLNNGAFVCSKHGDTGISMYGAVTAIKRVATADLPQLKAILDQNETARTRAGVY